MHMADALISPQMGGGMLLVSGGLLGYCCRRIRMGLSERKIPLMGVAGAFVFAAQMINFTIPGTGSSGHLGGGLLLAILLGPWAGFLVMASVLVVQALFFADGGLLALGCNIFNLGFWTCFVAYPYIYSKIAGASASRGRILAGAILAAVVGLQLGAFSVVLQTIFSGRTELSLATFTAAMLPIHLAIGLVEGLVTAAVVLFVHQARPEALLSADAAPKVSLRSVAVALLVAAAVVGGVMSWFASSHPDGLEWSIAKVTGSEEVESPQEGLHGSLAAVQEKTAILPDYGFASAGDESEEQAAAETWPAVSTGTSVSGLVGGVITLALAVVIGFALKMGRRAIPAAA